MKLEHAELIVKAAADLGHDVTLHADYSGRGMCGKQTAGVVGKLGDIVQAIAAAAVDCATNIGDEFVDDMNLVIDSMGRDVILY